MARDARSDRTPHRERRPASFWLGRITVAAVAPLLALVAAEGALRLANVGFPATFFLHRSETAFSNEQFGWRFFPPRLAREPLALAVPERAPAGTLRIFVLGGSAAMGIPEPAFSFGRVLEVMLEEAAPAREVEVHNLAMTAINSHVVRLVASECLRLQPDLLVVYLGNNEVVGPYGVGTVFPVGVGGLGLTRLSIWLRGLRLGQAIEALLPVGAGRSGVWEGMEMFVGQRVAADDPRLATTREALRRNLQAMADGASAAGVPIILSTVAVNLKDSPPFASLHDPGLSEAQRGRFEETFERGQELATAGDLGAATAAYREALALDPGFADLHFRLGQSSLALGDPAARVHFEAARDLDALRFRADGVTNEIIRGVAGDHPEVRLVDAAKALARAPESTADIPGSGLFWEHVHLNFTGNYRLASAVFEVASEVLGLPSAPAPSEEICARRLVLTPWDVHRMAADILSMTSRQPFVDQLDHEERHRELRARVRELEELSRASLDETERRLRSAATRDPDDLQTEIRLAELLEERGCHAEAADRWRALLERVPGRIEWLTRLGLVSLHAGNRDEAEAIMGRVVAERRSFPQSHLNLGFVRERAGDDDGARAAYERALEIDPGFVPARLNLGSLLESQGRLGDAESQYRLALDVDPGSADARFGLGTVLERKGLLEDAAVSYRLALASDPDLAKAGNNLGLVLERLGRPGEAEGVYRRAIEARPRYAMTHFNLADLLLTTGRPVESAERYRVALELEPGNLQARINLALSQQLQGEDADAEETLRDVLRRAPDSVETRLRLAWLLATSRDPGVADPSEAVQLAGEAVELTRSRVPEVLETQAQVLEAVGRTGEAIEVFRRALQLARAAGSDDGVARLLEQLRGLE